MAVRLLVIAGSNSSAGAGIQADLKTAQAFGVYAQTVITAVTAQDTRGVHAAEVMPPELVRAQIAAALNDIGADAIKIGMLGNGAVAAAVADALGNSRLPLVLDPVLLSTSGSVLLDAAGVDILKSRLLPRALLVTPNLPETQALVGIDPRSDDDYRSAAECFASLGCAHVLFKDGHGEGETVRDVLADGDSGVLTPFVAARQDSRHTHGTGCTLATAIACGLAEGLALTGCHPRAGICAARHRHRPGIGQRRGAAQSFIEIGLRVLGAGCYPRRLAQARRVDRSKQPTGLFRLSPPMAVIDCGSTHKRIAHHDGVVAVGAGGEQRHRRADQLLDPAHILDRIGGQVGPAAGAGGGLAPAFHALHRPASAAPAALASAGR